MQSEKKGELFMTPLFFSTDCHQQIWREFWRANLNTFFQMALLLTADPQEAEANLTSVIEAADMSQQPGEDALTTLQTEVARYGIERAGAIWPAGTAEARSMLQADLWPVLQVERYRVSVSSCGSYLDMQHPHVPGCLVSTKVKSSCGFEQRLFNCTARSVLSSKREMAASPGSCYCFTPKAGETFFSHRLHNNIFGVKRLKKTGTSKLNPCFPKRVLHNWGV
ncbi:MAG: hypothetical protein QOJ99_4875 [Bryobacterales bacterium]|jgi:hypothetical protein|nr:hypothetical protein [Bryobacterales bacterium]